MVLALVAAGAHAQISPARIPQTPDIFGDRVAFESEGDIWIGDLISGQATRLTSWPGPETRPKFSRDGKHIAFTGTYDNRNEVYMVGVDGGVPQRLTYDPMGASMVDWMPDGKSILFRSERTGPGDMRLFLGQVSGTMPQVLPMPMAAQGSVSAGGDMIAYVRIPLETHNWKRYKGGMANDIFVFNRTANSFTQLTKHEINEQYPVFMGERLFFVSEKNGTANLFEYNLKTNSERQVTKHTTYDVMAPASDGKRIVYRLGQDLYVWDPSKNEPERVKLRVTSDMIHAKPYSIAGSMDAFGLGPTGTRVLIEDRGQIFSAPADLGDIRPVASWPGSKNQMSTWAPNGKSIAFISDKSDEQNIWTSDQNGGNAKQLTRMAKIGLWGLQWFPNSQHLVVWDNSSTLWMVNAQTGVMTKIAQDEYAAPTSAAISQDSRLVAYVKGDAFNQSSVWIYDTETKQHHRVTKAPHKDSSPTFDRTGRYLYFLGDRSVSLNWDAFDFQMNANSPTRIMYTSLTGDALNPFAEKIDEEPAGETPAEAKPGALVYDLPGAASRVASVPGVVGNLRNLVAGEGQIWWIDGGTLNTWDTKAKKVQPLGTGVSNFDLTADGKKMGVMADGRLVIGPIGAPLPGKPVNLSAWRVPVEPLKEWRHILRDGWRHIRDNFYDPNLHGANWNQVWEDVSAQLPAVADRADLNDLIGQMQATVDVSHMYNGGGTNRFAAPAGGPAGFGVLGCDFEWKNGGLQITRLFRGDGFEENVTSPLLAAPANAKEGDFIVAIGGETLSMNQDPMPLLEGKAGQLVKVTLNSKPGMDGARTVWVRAMRSETMARYFDWTAWNREYVEKNGGTNLAYLHLPDMGNFGMSELTKHLYANLHKDGLILDVRYNGGGITSGMVLERLRRVIFEYDQARYGAAFPYHRMGFVSKVVIVCNEFTASDGEYFSIGFRMMKLGQSVGKRTWGGYAAVSGVSTLDGGNISAPVQGSYSPDGKWLPDGYGFKPDVEVDIDVKSFLAGRDPQLDKAIAMVKEEIRKNPPVRPGRQVPPVKIKP